MNEYLKPDRISQSDVHTDERTPFFMFTRVKKGVHWIPMTAWMLGKN